MIKRLAPRNVAFLCSAVISATQLFGAQPAWAARQILVQLHVTQADLAPEGQGHRKAMGFSDGGQFEILLKPSSVPVTAPMCHNAIIARMPWSDSSDAGAPAAIAAKKQLFDQFEALKNGKIDSVDVTVDAAPYGKQVSSSPRVVKLSECNVFFLNP